MKDEVVYYHKLSWGAVEDLTTHLALSIKQTGIAYDAIVSVGRGGMVLARMLSEKLKVKDVYMFNVRSYNSQNKQENVAASPFLPDFTGKNVLCVDDCIFTGDTWKVVELSLVNDFNANVADLAVLHCNMDKFNGNQNFYYAVAYSGNSEWIVYPWEIGLD